MRWAARAGPGAAGSLVPAAAVGFLDGAAGACKADLAERSYGTIKQGAIRGGWRRASQELGMILTGPAIAAAVARGDILIDPFNLSDLNPNSYNYHLFPEIYKGSASCHPGEIPSLPIPGTGLLLEPDCLYLGCTDEIFHSTRYAMTLVGRSSVGRLGLFVNISADLGHVGSHNRWTLEIKVIQPVIVYPHQCIGQVAFWETTGMPDRYAGRYQHDERPYPSKDARLLSSPHEADA